MDELYVGARQVLLDGLEALGVHRAAVILVGAQAIYLRVGEGDLAIAPYTTDADLAIDPSRLGPIPPLEQALLDNGFRPKTKDSVGIWVTTRTVGSRAVDISVDLLLPDGASSNPNSRAAQLDGHDRRAVRNVAGLDGAFVDQDVMTVAAFDVEDLRKIEVAVAGPAAMLVAKLQKIEERLGTDRLSDKDALDVLRLLRGTTTIELSGRYRTLMNDERTAKLGERGRGQLQRQFIDKAGIGPGMLTRAIKGLGDPAELIASARVLAQDLLDALGN